MFSFLNVLNESKLANITTREKSLINSIWRATSGFSRSSLIPLVGRLRFPAIVSLTESLEQA